MNKLFGSIWTDHLLRFSIFSFSLEDPLILHIFHFNLETIQTFQRASSTGMMPKLLTKAACAFADSSFRKVALFTLLIWVFQFVMNSQQCRKVTEYNYINHLHRDCHYYRHCNCHFHSRQSKVDCLLQHYCSWWVDVKVWNEFILYQVLFIPSDLNCPLIHRTRFCQWRGIILIYVSPLKHSMFIWRSKMFIQHSKTRPNWAR